MNMMMSNTQKFKKILLKKYIYIKDLLCMAKKHRRIGRIETFKSKRGGGKSSGGLGS